MLSQSVTNGIVQVGRVVIFLLRTLRTTPQIFANLRLTTRQMLEVGVNSLPIVLIVAIFAGATTAWQANYQLKGYVPVQFIGTAVSKAILIELAPVLTSLIVAGRIGSSLAAELGTMRVTEQIDALSVIGIDPFRYLILPRITAGFLMMPILVIFFNLIGIWGGYIVAVKWLKISSQVFIHGLKQFFETKDVLIGLFKAFTFGGILSLMGCYYGFFAEGGAEGVGKAAIKAFVSSAVVILLINYVIASIMF